LQLCAFIVQLNDTKQPEKMQKGRNEMKVNMDNPDFESARVCSECKKEMWEGFCIDGGLDYYCTEECLLKNMTWDEYLELYDDGEGDSYYTEWEE
jgi:gamma-glutamylcysteine synthetase